MLSGVNLKKNKVLRYFDKKLLQKSDTSCRMSERVGIGGVGSTHLKRHRELFIQSGCEMAVNE